jgi:hypothetical protein
MHRTYDEWLNTNAGGVVRMFPRIAGVGNVLSAGFMKVNVYVFLSIVAVSVCMDVYSLSNNA